ncbi:MAG: metal ABC transporter substrate-binding protein, partial [Candidatus Paceibacterota bacterium]
MNKKIVIGMVSVAIIGAVYFFGHNRATVPASSSGKIKTATSFYPVYFLAQRIGGEKAEVSNITPAGAEPHDYEPTAVEMAAIENSRIVFLNGGGLETWGNDVQKTLDPKKTIVITAGNGLTNLQKDEEGETITDPHVWLDPELMQKMADAVLGGFIAADPDNKNYYENNAAKLKSELAALDEEYRQGFADCAKKEIVTSHSAFGYLAARYGLKQVSVAGLSP